VTWHTNFSFNAIPIYEVNFIINYNLSNIYIYFRRFNMRKSIIIFCFCTMLYFGIPVLIAFADDYTPVNHPPEAQDISLTTEKNTGISIPLKGSDEDGDVLTYTVHPPEENGTVTHDSSTNEVVFMPADGFLGNVTFAYSVSDGFTSADAQINIEVIDSGIQETCVEDESGQIDVAGGIGASGGLVTIPVRINNAPNDVSSFGFELVYDPAMLIYKGFERGALTEDFDYFDAQIVSDGIIRCGGAQNKDIHNGASGSILFVEFEIIQADPATKLSLRELKDDIANWTTSSGCFQSGCNGDVNADGEITPMDALNVFEKYLSICPTSSDLDCNAICGDVNKDGDTTPADTLCIFKSYLGMPNCLDTTSYVPEANASATPKRGEAPLTVWFAAAYDENADGSGMVYQWDFQDDGTFDAKGPEVEFTYFREGTYTAILQVTDMDGLIATDEITITVEPGNTEENVITIVARPPEGPAPLSVYFYAEDHLDPVVPTDSVGNIVNIIENITNIDIDNAISSILPGDRINTEDGKDNKWFWEPPSRTKFEWDFNDDGKVDARGREARWMFKEEGEHLVHVKGIYEDGSVAIGATLVHVHEPEPYKPEKIYIVARPAIGKAPLETKMYVFGYFAKEYLANVKIEWYLDNDNKPDAHGVEVFHTFEEEGEYQVKVLVTDVNGETLSAETKIVVKPNMDDPVDAKIIAMPDQGPAPLEVKFKLTTRELKHLINHECRIQWDFESDGQMDAQGPFVSHVYEDEGEFIATCQITDARGNVYSTKTIIMVGDDNRILPEIPEQIAGVNESLEPIVIPMPDDLDATTPLRLVAKSSNERLISEIQIEQENNAWIVSIVPERDQRGWAVINLSLENVNDIIAITKFEVTIISDKDDFDKDDFNMDDFDKDDYNMDDFDKDDFDKE